MGSRQALGTHQDRAKVPCQRWTSRRKREVILGETVTPHVGETVTPHVGETVTPHVGETVTPHVGETVTPFLIYLVSCL
jgi:hypothetical protein